MRVKTISITVGASPFVYRNTFHMIGYVSVNGGTVSDISFSRDNINFISVSSSTGVIIILAPNDQVKVTYSVTPTMNFIPLI